MIEYAVNSPNGGYGNHIRWLLLFDPNFNFPLQCCTDLNDEPSPNDPVHPFGSVNEKLDFIQNYVYNQHRSWHNWLTYEYRYRIQLQSHIFFSHDYINIMPAPVKTVVCTISPDLAYKSYLKFNSYLNRTTEDLFKRVTANNNWHVEHLATSNHHIINSDKIFSPTLDRDLYEKMINFLNFSDLYDSANTIHQLWYKLHKKSEKEFVEHVQQLYN